MASEQAQQFIEQAVQSLQGGQVYQALELADQAISLDPASDEGYILCGVALSQSNQPQAASEAFLTAIEINPDNSKAFYNYAVHLYSTGQKGEALLMANHASTIDPGHAAARDMANRIEVESGLRVEDQEPVPVPKQSPLEVRPGYELPLIHAVPFVERMGAGWVAVAGVIAVGSLANFAVVVTAILSQLSGGATFSKAIEGGLATASSALLLFAGISWTVIDILDQRGKFLWVIPQALCGLFSGGFISLPLYVFAGRQKF